MSKPFVVGHGRGLRSGNDLATLAREAQARFEALSPEQQAAHREAQRQSFIRGMTTPCEHGVLDFEQCGQCRAPTQEALTMTPTVFAFCSPVMGSGKSAAAQHLVTRHGFRLLKFAAPLKDMTRALLPHLGVPHHEVEDHVEGDRKAAPLVGFDNLTTRQIMQTLGTEWGRQTIARDFWTRIVAERCQAELATGRSVVIDDMRFHNEYAAVREIGGLCYRIVRPDAPCDATNHASEGELDGVAMPEIWNRQDLPRLHEKLDLLIRESR